jgi:hypothetical protein
MVEDQEDNLEELRKLYPHLTDQELHIAGENLRRYVLVMVRIYERIRREQGPEAASKLSRGE